MKPFTSVAVLLFAVIAIVHLLRMVLGWQVTFNGKVVPMWMSLVAFGVTALLAVMLWRENRKK